MCRNKGTAGCAGEGRCNPDCPALRALTGTVAADGIAPQLTAAATTVALTQLPGFENGRRGPVNLENPTETDTLANGVDWD